MKWAGAGEVWKAERMHERIEEIATIYGRGFTLMVERYSESGRFINGLP